MAIAAFISFRLKVMDGVSFAVEKRIAALEKWDLEVHRIAGMIPGAGTHDHIIPELNHLDPEVEAFNDALLDGGHGREELQARLDELSRHISSSLSALLDELDPNILFCENVFSTPVNMPLTVALCRYIEDRAITAVAVHHQLGVNDSRYHDCPLGDIIESHVPASMPQLVHITGSESRRDEIFQRTGLSAYRWRDYYEFDAHPEASGSSRSLLHELGIGDGTLILQPSLFIDESAYLSVGFAESFFHAGEGPVQLLVTGECRSGFENEFARLRESSSLDIVHIHEGVMMDMAAIDVLCAAYAGCDVLVCPGGENIGDPVMESIVLKKPLVIGGDQLMDGWRDQGFQFLPLDGGAGLRAFRLMCHPELLEELTRRNHEVGRRRYSSQVFSEQVESLLRTAMVAVAD